MLVLLLSLFLTVLEVVVNTTIVAREFELFVRDTEKYVILISILSPTVGLLLKLALGTPSIHTLEWKFSARVFPVWSKTPLTSRFVVHLLQLLQFSLESTLSNRMSPQSHAVVQVLLSLSRRLTACPGHPRSRFTSLLTLCLHYPKVCRVIGLKTQDSMEWIFSTFGLSFIPTKSNHPGRFS